MKLNQFNKRLKEEYNESFKKEELKKKLSIHIKLIPVYALATLILVFIGVLTIDSIAVNIYNSSINTELNQRLDEMNEDWDSKELVRISSKSDLFTYLFRKPKTSIWSSLCDTMSSGWSNREMYQISNNPDSTSDNHHWYSGNSYNTNVQVEGIDEADIAKCDGTYIYYAMNKSLYIYDLYGNLIVNESLAVNISELMIYENSIIGIDENNIIIYSFDGTKVEKAFSYNFYNFLNARMTNGYLYFVVQNFFYEDDFTINYPTYYDGYSSSGSLYEVYKINLKTYEAKIVELVSGYTSHVYMSNSYFVVASNVSNNLCDYCLLSIFDIDLNPVAVIKGVGNVINQYCMDEKDDMLRFVLSYASQNSISIYDLNSLNRVGFLNEGIGLTNQTVRSVSFGLDICYICTYEVTDPLYEIDLSDSTNPIIVSAYEAPGYSEYLYQWNYSDMDYVLGLGYTDDDGNIKISVYKKTEEGTIQIGKDYVISNYDDNSDYFVKHMNWSMFSLGKTLFIYKEGNHLYLGTNVSYDKYTIFDIELSLDSANVSIEKEIEIQNTTRCFLVNGKLYLPQMDKVIIL